MPCQKVTIEEKTPESTLNDLSLASCNVEPVTPDVGETVTFTATIKNKGATPISIVPRFTFGDVGVRGNETSIPSGGSIDVEGTLKVDDGLVDFAGSGVRDVSIEAKTGGSERSFSCGTITIPSKDQNKNEESSSDDGGSDGSSGDDSVGGIGGDVGSKIRDNKKLAASAGIIGLALLSGAGK